MRQIQRSILLLLALCFAVSAGAEQLKPVKGQKAVRVCADGYNLPYSDKNEKGFDNRIAELLGKELGIPVEYYYFPQRIGFSRNTIKKVNPETGMYNCDVAMSIPEFTDFLKPTKPYWSSIESMVYRSGEGYELKTIADLAKATKDGQPLKIGIFDRGITTKALLDLGLADHIQYYQMMSGDARVNAGRIVDAVDKGDIDVALLWGPIAGYYASIASQPLTVQPLNELGEAYVFSFSMGTRYGDKQWNALLNKFIDKYQVEIAEIIAEYHLPSLDNVNPYPKKRRPKDDDD
jgi:quinoprotein dehydrogenase-associated probable ABC transporter substrate-binding protein